MVALPGLFPCWQIVVEAAETVLVESVGHRLMVALPVFLEVIQKISVTAVLENQVCWSCIKKKKGKPINPEYLFR